MICPVKRIPPIPAECNITSRSSGRNTTLALLLLSVCSPIDQHIKHQFTNNKVSGAGIRHSLLNIRRGV